MNAGVDPSLFAMQWTLWVRRTCLQLVSPISLGLVLYSPYFFLVLFGEKSLPNSLFIRPLFDSGILRDTGIIFVVLRISTIVYQREVNTYQEQALLIFFRTCVYRDLNLARWIKLCGAFCNKEQMIRSTRLVACFWCYSHHHTKHCSLSQHLTASRARYSQYFGRVKYGESNGFFRCFRTRIESFV